MWKAQEPATSCYPQTVAGIYIEPQLHMLAAHWAWYQTIMQGSVHTYCRLTCIKQLTHVHKCGLTHIHMHTLTHRFLSMIVLHPQKWQAYHSSFTPIRQKGTFFTHPFYSNMKRHQSCISSSSKKSLISSYFFFHQIFYHDSTSLSLTEHLWVGYYFFLFFGCASRKTYRGLASM